MGRVGFLETKAELYQALQPDIIPLLFTTDRCVARRTTARLALLARQM